MENLLDKHGWKFECDLDGDPQHGIVKVTDYDVCLKFFDCDEVYEVGNGSLEDIKQHYPEITNFRLLEPESKESTVSKEEAGKVSRKELISGLQKTVKDCDEIQEKLKNDLKRISELKIIRRETATQLLAGLLANPAVVPGNHPLVKEAIEYTDLLLKKLGG